MTVTQHAQCQHPETEAAQWSSAITKLIIYTFSSSTLSCQNDLNEAGAEGQMLFWKTLGKIEVYTVASERLSVWWVCLEFGFCLELSICILKTEKSKTFTTLNLFPESSKSSSGFQKKFFLACFSNYAIYSCNCKLQKSVFLDSK